MTYGDTDTYGECRDSHESRSDEVTVGMAHCVRSRKEDFSCCRNRSAIGVMD